MIPDVRFLCIPLLTFIFGGLGLVPAADVAGRKPNIVVIFTDDWGHGDVGAHGVLDDIKTPHLDRLAKEGALFTDGYVTSPQCAPSRAGLITGRYQQRFDFDFIGLGPMPLGETTIAQRLQKADYV
ncbi:MAG: sulfatase-like hydrolase/transferase, partial [Chthoniobacterales bacterium]